MLAAPANHTHLTAAEVRALLRPARPGQPADWITYPAAPEGLEVDPLIRRGLPLTDVTGRFAAKLGYSIRPGEERQLTLANALDTRTSSSVPTPVLENMTELRRLGLTQVPCTVLEVQARTALTASGKLVAVMLPQARVLIHSPRLGTVRAQARWLGLLPVAETIVKVTETYWKAVRP